MLGVIDHRFYSIHSGHGGGSGARPVVEQPSRGPARGVRSQSEQVADREREVGTVHGVEMKVADPAVDEIEHLLGRDRGSDELACCRIMIESVETVGEPM